MIEAASSALAQTDRPACSLQIILLTYKASALADDMFQSAANLARRQPGLQVVVAWGGEAGPRQSQWQQEVAWWQSQGADVVLVIDPSPLQRVRMALALDDQKEWVLPLADDDPVAVNYLRAMVEGTQMSGPGVCALLPSNQMQNFSGHANARRQNGWIQPTPAGRLFDMLSNPGQQGLIFWACYRRSIFANWLAYGLTLPFQPSYLDQFLPHLAACHGILGVLPEETSLLKDERNWESEASCTHNNARYYPHPEMALYHEWFWAADLWDFLQTQMPANVLALPLKVWAADMMGRMLGSFERRCRQLGVRLSPAHADVLDDMRTACGWLFEPGHPEDPVRGMNRVSAAARDLRERWLQAGQVPARETLEAHA